MPAQTSVAQPLPDPLSPRELEVLQLLAAGASNQEIAAAPVLAPATVKLHVSHILSKIRGQESHATLVSLQRSNSSSR
jgi:DNA-binding NarL/FixJ family response regulator